MDYESRKKSNFGYMYVLSIKDIQQIKKCSYDCAKRELFSYNYFYINSKPYILATEYFGKHKFSVSNFLCQQSIDGEIEVKIIKIMPQMYTVHDIQVIFGCGQRQAYEIMDIIPGSFRINSKRYVEDKCLREWLDSLPNKKLSIA